MGVIEVLMNIRTIKRNLDFCKRDLLEYRPDVVILIDYPGFNLKMAEFAHNNGLRVFYYISPKIWAWKEWRIKKIKAFVDEMFTILPFETEFYARHNFPVHYVGNPLVEEVENFKSKPADKGKFFKENGLDNRPVVALLPGSRRQEIKYMLPVMARFADEYPDFQFVVSGAPSIEQGLYKSILGSRNLPVVFGQTYSLLSFSYAALVTSGTATLETALLNIPQVVLYKMAGGALSYKFVKLFLLKVEYVSLPNLVLSEEAVKEFVMSGMKFPIIKPEVEKLLNNEPYRQKIFTAYARLKELMGQPGGSVRAAKKMAELLNPAQTP